ncbi:class B sortase, LPKTxAVK-specific [Streptococcus pantholopis]|uniref:SrtB family sortase n=1 Tax=Streptococcus pantholopis TaxID=1811193 RepID=A0A172Q5B1_9STRE|nr:class B sortase, LPKTxAVK-specific [Streptococcus pantholopis]AND78638.1 SrtB family sortase [Streptococcus pantholopis]
MKRNNRIAILLIFLLILVSAAAAVSFFGNKSSQTPTPPAAQTSVSSAQNRYTVSQEEKDYLKERFADLWSVNPETVAYIYAPGTMLDEPVVQTGDNETYLNKTFDGGYEPFMGTVFMDKDNSKNFDNSLTWLFGHARGSMTSDHRMFNDVNFYDSQSYFNDHPYLVVETPSRKYYYEAAFMIIVPETTALYQTSFDSLTDFKKQLTQVAQEAHTKNINLLIDENDNYLVLSTCREEDETIRSNLYWRQIPDDELTDFLAKEGQNLTYQNTR